MPDISEHADTPRTEDSAHRTFSLWPWTLFFLFVVYPLSIGPVAKLHNICPPARPAIEAVYLPIVAVIKRVPAVDHFFRWYIKDLWQVR